MAICNIPMYQYTVCNFARSTQVIAAQHGGLTPIAGVQGCSIGFEYPIQASWYMVHLSIQLELTIPSTATSSPRTACGSSQRAICVHLSKIRRRCSLLGHPNQKSPSRHNHWPCSSLWILLHHGHTSRRTSMAFRSLFKVDIRRCGGSPRGWRQGIEGPLWFWHTPEREGKSRWHGESTG